MLLSYLLILFSCFGADEVNVLGKCVYLIVYFFGITNLYPVWITVWI